MPVITELAVLAKTLAACYFYSVRAACLGKDCSHMTQRHHHLPLPFRTKIHQNNERLEVGNDTHPSASWCKSSSSSLLIFAEKSCEKSRNGAASAAAEAPPCVVAAVPLTGPLLLFPAMDSCRNPHCVACDADEQGMSAQ